MRNSLHMSSLDRNRKESVDAGGFEPTQAYARADASGGREADAERFSALIKALTGREPRVRRMKNGEIVMECYREHLRGFARFAELADAIRRWLEETGQ